MPIQRIIKIRHSIKNSSVFISRYIFFYSLKFSNLKSFIVFLPKKSQAMKNCIVLFLFLFGWYYSILSQPQYTFKRLTMSDGMVSNYIVDIIQDKQGYIWMASESGLCKFDGKDFTIYNIGNSAIGSNAQNVLYYNEADNTVWVGTQRDGISIFDCEKQTFITNGVPDMITRDVTDLSPAADGGIWITHYH